MSVAAEIGPASLVVALLAGGVVPADWLVVAPTDGRGRRPFNPSATFAAHLVDPDAPPPKAGATLTGELGNAQAWTARHADDHGNVAGDPPLAAAFTTVEWPDDGVALADLDGAGTVWVNGVPQIGDPYGDGYGGLPVPMKKGTNQVFVTGLRGGFRLEFTAPESELLVDPFDATRGDLVAGTPAPVEIALVLVNASARPLDDLVVAVADGAAAGPFEPGPLATLPTLAPRGLVKLPATLRPRADRPELAQPGTVQVELRVTSGALVRTTRLTLDVRPADALRRCTRRSSIDGSVQEFALLPPAGGGHADALVLSLHGAGVDCMGQAASYSAKPDFWLAAPTNRRRFGFDWQDWGRRDAYESLADALRRSGADPRRVFLTGHSMGGHGTWHLAANDPATFRAIAPSAGWSSFESYVGSNASPLAPLWRGADGGSQTLALLDNVKQLPAFVVHGTKDDNVPVSEAQRMIDALTAAGTPPQVHLEEGAGHWWDGPAAAGVDCVDWPGIFELFRKAPARDLDSAVSFVSADPSLTSRVGWVELLQPLEYGKPARLAATVVAAAAPAAGSAESPQVALTTANVRRLAVDLDGPRRGATLTLDGTPFAAAATPHRSFLRAADGWVEQEPAREKRPDWSGPLKRAFDRGFVLVHASHGNAAENALSYERARQDAATWWYRANGHVEVVRDDEFVNGLARRYASCNVILYGNEVTNGAWRHVVDGACPIRARRGELALGATRYPGDALGAAFVRPRRGDPATVGDALVAVFADTGVAGARLGFTLLPFISGVGYPDYVLFSRDVLTQGDGGVLAAGWFDAAWNLAATR